MISSSILLVLCAFGTVISKNTGVAEEYVDLIELNHFYDHQGRHVYDQVIFYEQAPESGRFLVRAWCLVEDREHQNRRPIKDASSELYRVHWYDSDQRMHRKIVSQLYRESWTQVDPERANKRIHDEHSRISLVQVPKKVDGPNQDNSLAERESRPAPTAATETLVQR